MIANDSLDELYADLASNNSEALWKVIKRVNPKDPAPRAVAHLWPYATMRPLLERAGALVSTADAERRVAMLVNPGIGKIPFTTDTIYAGLQLLMPGEVARAHKHTAFAMRYIIEGTDAYTAVGGVRVQMHVGDVVLTPPMEFHDHGNDSDSPMVWLDGLDVPLFQWLPVHFTRFFTAEQYPATPLDGESPLVYPWAEMKSALGTERFAVRPYLRRDTGAPISATMGAQAERIAAGTASPQRRETASSIYHVVAGAGSTQVGDQTFAWQARDTFVVPAWTTFVHAASGVEAAYLVRFDDTPLLRALNVYRTEEPA